MTSRQRVLRILDRTADGQVAYDALGGEAVGDVIGSLGLSEDWTRYFGAGDIRYVGLEPARGERELFAPYVSGLPAEAFLSCWGIGRIALTSANGHHAGHKYWHPLAGVNTVAELDRYPFPDLSRVNTLSELIRQVTALQQQGFAVVGQMSQTILETAYLMRGLAQLMVDLYERPAYIDRLFGRLAEQRMMQAALFARAGVDAIRIGDDIATQEALMMSPRMYRERLKPYHAAVISTARQIAPDLPIEYHSDGSLTDLLPELIEIGVNAINPVQPECMDLLDIKREFGMHLTLWGCTPVQSVYAHGTAEQVREHTRFLFEKVAADHGVIIQFMNIVLTPLVLDNLAAFFDEFVRLSGARPLLAEPE